jgi:hypothetical protein
MQLLLLCVGVIVGVPANGVFEGVLVSVGVYVGEPAAASIILVEPVMV